jgi:hypothetical protein
MKDERLSEIEEMDESMEVSARDENIIMELIQALRDERERNKRLEETVREQDKLQTFYNKEILRYCTMYEAERKRVEHLKNALYELSSIIHNGNPSNEQLEEVITKYIHGLVTGRLNL